MNPYEGRSAYDILSSASERELADIFFNYGEERAARRIAHAIVERRTSRASLPKTTTEFAQLVSGVVHRPGTRERIHPATRVFQALRIAVNDELDVLRDGLVAAIDSLRGGGRVVAISFHSLEDRIVKQTFRGDERVEILTKKPLVPDEPRWRKTHEHAAPSCAPRNGRRARLNIMAMVQPKVCRPERPRIRNPRSARNATQTRVVKNARARYGASSASSAAWAWRSSLLMTYVMLLSNTTSLSYALDKAQHQRDALQEQTSRLDDRIAQMSSEERLAVDRGQAQDARSANVRAGGTCGRPRSSLRASPCSIRSPPGSAERRIARAGRTLAVARTLLHGRTFARVAPMRAKVFFYLCAGGRVSFSCVRLYLVQIVQGPALAREALAQRSDTVEVFARRGFIADRNGIAAGALASLRKRLRGAARSAPIPTPPSPNCRAIFGKLDPERRRRAARSLAVVYLDRAQSAGRSGRSRAKRWTCPACSSKKNHR